MSFLSRLFPVHDLKATIERFPLSIACAVLLFVFSLGLIHDLWDPGDDTIGRMVSLFSVGFFWFGISTLVTESRQWDMKRYLMLAAPGFAALGLLLFLAPQWQLHILFLSPALLLLVMVAPYSKISDDLSFWFFNRMVWFGFAVSVLAAIVFCGGLTAALASINYLFDIKIPEEIYGDIWVFASCLLGPIYALSWVPRQFMFSESDCHDPPGLAFLVNWILAPLVLVYLLILYAYLAKILVTGELPRGQLSYMITGFGGAGVVTYLLAWPLRDRGTPLLRLFYRVFFPALIVPAAMLFYAVYERISTYGVTEQRYAIVLAGLWLAFIAAVFSWRKLPLKFIPLALAVLCLLASFGPWGAVSVSEFSQFSRLKDLLARHEILKDGKIVKAAQAPSFDDRKNISSIVDYLISTRRFALIAPMIAADAKSQLSGKEENFGVDYHNYSFDPERPSAYEITYLMGFSYVSQWQSEDVDKDSFDFSRPYSEGSQYVAGYDYVFLNRSFYTGSKGEEKINLRNVQGYDLPQNVDAPPPPAGDLKPLELVVTFDRNVLKFVVHDSELGVLDMTPLVKEKIAQRQNPQYQMGPWVLETPKGKVKVFFSHVRGKIENEAPVIDSISYDFYLKLNEHDQ